MKIISKYKDYYDFLSGIYGVDEKLILDRRESFHPKYYKNGIMVFTIGNINIDVLCLDGKFYCGEADMIKLGGEKIEYKNSNLINYRISYKDKDNYNKIDKISICVTPEKLVRTNNRNDKYAIYLNDTVAIQIDGKYEHKLCSYPRLEQYGIQKVLSPHEIWLELSSWLSQQVTKNEKQVPVGDDNVRILSAGFDLKTSFRPKIKEK